MRLMFGVMAAALAALALRAEEKTLPFSDRIYLGSRPTVSSDGKQFVFEWNETLWLASTDGGEAEILLPEGIKNIWPVFSPDNRQVAFLSDRDGGNRIYVMDLQNRGLRQITYHTEEIVPYAWLGNELLTLSYANIAHGKPSARVAMVALDKRAAPQLVFDAAAGEPSLSPDGNRVLFTRRGNNLYRKGVKSSSAAQVWLFDKPSAKFTPVVQRDNESRTPLWRNDGKSFYYVSGQDGCMNVWLRDLESGKEQQITFFKDDSVIHPTLSADGKTMVFRCGFDFYKIDPRSPAKNPYRIVLTPNVKSQRPDSRRRFYTECWNNDSDGDVTFCDNGMQIAFTTGGDLFVMDTQIRQPRLVQGDTRTQERECFFSRDGKTLYYLSDRGDGIDLWKAERADPKLQWWENFEFKKTRLTNDDQCRENLHLSPDGTRLAWQDETGTIRVADTNGVEIARGPKASGAGQFSWSPDNNWMAAAINDAYGNSDIWIFPLDKSREPYNISRCFKGDHAPCWSPDGKILAFCGARPDNPNQHNIFYVWLDPKEESKEYAPVKRRIAAHRAVLESTGENKNKPEEKKEEPKEESTATRVVSDSGFVIDFDNLWKRLHRIKNRSGVDPFFSYNSRTLFFISDDGTYKVGIPDALTPQKLTDKKGRYCDFIKKGDRLLWVVDNVPAHLNQKFPFEARQVTDLRDYQELAFLTGWRRLRDYFYDPNLHGADWNAVKNKYREAARFAPSISVFSRVMQMMLGELNASHLGYYTGTYYGKEWEKRQSFQSWPIETGHLGLEFDNANIGEGWLVKSVIPGSPADRDEADIAPADCILAIDGRTVRPNDDPTLFLNGAAGHEVMLTVRSPDGKIKQVAVKTISYSAARNLAKKAYSDEMRRRVHEASDGKLGYLDVEQMDLNSYYLFEEEIFSEGFDKEGMIIDVRSNPGGFTADRLIRVLCGGRHSYAAYRNSDAAYLGGYWGELPVFNKPIVVMCNENTGSNGEIFSHAIKALKRGKLVGETTGGAVIATSERRLLDYGMLRNPHRGWFTIEGLDMEEYGAEPDVRVQDDPNFEVQDVDVQLNVAIKTLMEEVEAYRKANPPVKLQYFNRK